MTESTEPTSPQYERAVNLVNTARTYLATAATEGKAPETLVNAVHDLARAEAVERFELDACYRLVWMQKDNPEATQEDARKSVAETAAEQLLDVGADDTWSGRNNDLRRVVFDAKRDWVRRTVRGF